MKEQIKEKRNDDKPKYEYTLSSVFPTPEIEEIAMKVIRDINERELNEEHPLVLKRNLTNKD